MSLSREATQENKDYLKGKLFEYLLSYYPLRSENCTSLFGAKFFECRLISACQLSYKADKFETRFLVISKFRIFVIHGKSPHSFKVERDFNLLALRCLVVQNEKEVCLYNLEALACLNLAGHILWRQAEERRQVQLSFWWCGTFRIGSRHLISFQTLFPRHWTLSSKVRPDSPRETAYRVSKHALQLSSASSTQLPKDLRRLQWLHWKWVSRRGVVGCRADLFF